METEALPASVHKLITEHLGGELLYLLTSIESHSGNSNRQRKVKCGQRERTLKGSKIDTEDELAVEEFLKAARSGGKAEANVAQAELKSKDVTLLEEYLCRPTLSELTMYIHMI